MTASFHRTHDPLAPHRLLSLALGQSPTSDDSGTTLPWRLRRESLGRSTDKRPHGHDRRSQPTPLGEVSPELTVSDVMTRDVISVSMATPVSEVARALTAKRISAVPVVSYDGSLLGIVSESDLIRRAEIGTQRRRPWWRKVIADVEAEAAEYVRTHGRRAQHVMTSEVVTATEDMTLADTADVMERQRLKRLLVVRGKHLVGIVSRSDLVKAVARHRARLFSQPPTDRAILRDLTARVKEVTPSHSLINVSVLRGNADVTGLVDSAAEREAIRVAAENTPGVRSIQDRLTVRPKSFL